MARAIIDSNHYMTLDSHAPIGTGQGVYTSAVAEELAGDVKRHS
jgi:hypothetical protein